MDPVIDQLIHSSEPSIRFMARTKLLDEDPTSPELVALQAQIKESKRVNDLFSVINASGEIPLHPYSKWQGAHWLLVQLADLHYPPGDPTLIPLCEQTLSFFFEHTQDGWKHHRKIFFIQGKTRACGSIEGNALLSMLKLDLPDPRLNLLAGLLIKWQWPDGGWNCDRTPEASHSSFHESLIPMRALHLYATLTGDQAAQAAVERAAEMFLSRYLFRRLSNGKVIDPHFILLHYPPYWHYDILIGLRAMAEIGRITDPRCSEALDILESKRLSNGGFPAEGRYYSQSTKVASNRSLVDWGGTSQKKLNEWVTLHALSVLKAAGRWTHSSPEN